MLPSEDDCDACTADYSTGPRLAGMATSTAAFALLPFVVTFLVVATLSWQRVVPRLSALGGADTTARRIVAVTFSITIALSAVLVQLLLCEISDLVDARTRGVLLRTTLFSLLCSIVVVAPALQAHAVAASLFARHSPRLGLVVRVGGFALWLACFWYMPRVSVIPYDSRDGGFVEACLERIGIIGVALMASLAGFAAVSSIWQTFGVRHGLVRETDIVRKESGLQAVEDMRATKESRLRALQRRRSQQREDAGDAKGSGIAAWVMGRIKGDADGNEQRALEMEISGLDTMAAGLSSSLATLKHRYAVQQRAHTARGRCVNTFGAAFAVYCLWRIAATSWSSLHRWWRPDATFASSDPINNVLALLTTHYDESLDRQAWARQISFWMTGVMLCASFNAVAQTFRLFARVAPGLLSSSTSHAQSPVAPLLVSQVAGTYVLSSALLLRSNLPPEVGGVISDALGAPLKGRFVEAWFESWFLVAVGLTSVGILVGRRLAVGEEGETWDDVGGDLESGKMV